MMEERPFGCTGQQVSVIGLGGGPLNKRSLADGVATVQRALELGVNYFDTAASYGDGASQVILGSALEGRNEPYLLATKIGFGSLAKPGDYRSLDAMRAQLRESLRALRRSQVDILQVHTAERACWWKDRVSPDELVQVGDSYDFMNAPIMQVLQEAKASGLCRFTGVTSAHAAKLAYILRHVKVDVCLLAYNHNLLFRDAPRSAIPVARENGVAYVAAGILTTYGYGDRPSFAEVRREWLSDPPSWVTPEIRDRLPALYDLQEACGLSLIELGIRYVMGTQDISTILMGAAIPSELEKSVRAAQNGPLPPDLHQAVEDLGLS